VKNNKKQEAKVKAKEEEKASRRKFKNFNQIARKCKSVRFLMWFRLIFQQSTMLIRALKERTTTKISRKEELKYITIKTI
jgi:hypothetical protein